MHIVVYGAGGVGGYFGGRLAQAGEKVTFIARGEHLQAMQANGLRVESPKGNFTIKPVVATDDIALVKDIDVVLLCVKTWQIPGAARQIQAALGLKTFVIPLENGVDAPNQLVEILGSKRVLGGLCGIFSHIASPGVIHHTGADPFIALGELDDCPTERVETFIQVLRNAGLDCEIPTDIRRALWQKFLLVAGLVGVGALTRVPVGIFRAQPGSRQMVEDIARECYQLGMAEGIDLRSDSVGVVMNSLDSIPADTIVSMQRDIMNGRPSELEEQNGAIVRLGQKHGVPTPVNAFAYYSLLPQENLARRTRV